MQKSKYGESQRRVPKIMRSIAHKHLPPTKIVSAAVCTVINNLIHMINKFWCEVKFFKKY